MWHYILQLCVNHRQHSTLRADTRLSLHNVYNLQYVRLFICFWACADLEKTFMQELQEDFEMFLIQYSKYSGEKHTARKRNEIICAHIVCCFYRFCHSYVYRTCIWSFVIILFIYAIGLFSATLIGQPQYYCSSHKAKPVVYVLICLSSCFSICSPEIYLTFDLI